tara:strand:- start:395 stop:691 length:297 start_codon:yes stop_codon:yes gene_type:complete
MKDFKLFLIGFLMCACMFLFMGHRTTSTFDYGISAPTGNFKEVYATQLAVMKIGSPKEVDINTFIDITPEKIWFFAKGKSSIELTYDKLESLLALIEE